MKIYTYIRYSSAAQDTGVSVELQRGAIKSFISSQSIMQSGVVIEHTDLAKTGTTYVASTVLKA